MPSSALCTSETQCLVLSPCYTRDTWYRAKTLACERRWTAVGTISVHGVCDTKGSRQASNRKHGLSLKIWKQENITDVGVNAHQVSVKSMGAKAALCLSRFQPSLDEKNQNRWEKQGWNRQISEHTEVRANSIWLFCPALVTSTEIKGDTNSNNLSGLSFEPFCISRMCNVQGKPKQTREHLP